MILLPDIRQKANFDCGAAVVRCVFKFYKMTMSHDFFISLLGTNGMNGTDPRTLESQIRMQGLMVLSGDLDIDDLATQTKKGRPVIVLVTLHGSGHYIIVSGVRYGHVHYQDPLVGPKKLRINEFVEVWTDYDRFGVTYKNFGMSIWKDK